MFYEAVIGGLVGLATYMYLHYLNKSKQRKQIEQVGKYFHFLQIYFRFKILRLLFRYDILFDPETHFH